MFRPVIVLALAGVIAAGCSGTGSSANKASAEKSADSASAQPPAALPSQQAAAPAPQPSPPSSKPPAETAMPESASAGKPTASPSTAEPMRAAPANPRAAAPSEPAAPRAPELRELTIPAGRTISVKLTTAVASDTSRVEDPVRGTLAKPIVVAGATVVPAGSEVTGTVLEANQSGRVKGRASIAFRFNRLIARDETRDIQTARIRREAESSERDDLKKGGIGAGVGAIVGGILGGGKGAVIGAGAGGAGTVLATRGKEVRLPAGMVVSTTLQEPLTVTVPVRSAKEE